MREIMYTLRCPNCDEEYFEGTQLEIDSRYEDVNWDEAEDGLVERLCDEYHCKMD